MTSKNSDPAPAYATRRRRRPLFRVAILVGLSLALIPTLLSRKALAKRAHETAAASPKALDRQGRIQALADELRARLAIPNAVVVLLVRSQRLVVSVERMKGQDGVFALLIEEGFLESLSEEEVVAIVAHELGHVW